MFLTRKEKVFSMVTTSVDLPITWLSSFGVEADFLFLIKRLIDPLYLNNSHLPLGFTCPLLN